MLFSAYVIRVQGRFTQQWFHKILLMLKINLLNPQSLRKNTVPGLQIKNKKEAVHMVNSFFCMYCCLNYFFL